MRTTETFEQHLRKNNLSENTIHSYLWTVDFYHAHYDEVNKENLLAYKGYLMEFFKPKTVNLRIQAMNKYLDFLHRDRLRLRAVKVQQKNFLENVISNADYNFMKKQLKRMGIWNGTSWSGIWLRLGRASANLFKSKSSTWNSAILTYILRAESYAGYTYPKG